MTSLEQIRGLTVNHELTVTPLELDREVRQSLHAQIVAEAVANVETHEHGLLAKDVRSISIRKIIDRPRDSAATSLPDIETPIPDIQSDDDFNKLWVQHQIHLKLVPVPTSIDNKRLQQLRSL